MLRSLFSGISGMRAHQQMMDVTGNNISNVNTTGYKTSQTVFQDTLSQMVRAAGSPQGGAGGTNPAQIGLGVTTASVNVNFNQGSAQTTGKSSDMMIQGDGFFIVKNGGENLFTRAGSFTFDANGALTTSNGDIVQGWTATDGVVNNAGLPGDIKLPIGVTLSPSVTSKITLTGNFSNEAVANDATDPNSTKQIPIKSVYDATGAEVPLTVTLTKTAADTWTLDVPPHGTTPADSQPIVFVNGRATGTVTAGGFDFDVAGLTQFTGANDARVSNSDGAAAGVLRSYTVSNTGEIVGVFSNGLTETLGQVALANFNNANGLEKVGESMYRSTPNSGLAQIGAAGTTGLGTIMSGALEMSNVDLAQEFTNLVIAQRGFQANSRVITTSDELLQELVNLKR